MNEQKESGYCPNCNEYENCTSEYKEDAGCCDAYKSNRRREMREKLAEYAHNQWSGWMEYLFSKCYTVYLEPTLQEPDGEAHLVIPKWAVDRWKRQMQTPYNDLSEEEKESDRKEADGMIAILTK